MSIVFPINLEKAYNRWMKTAQQFLLSVFGADQSKNETPTPEQTLSAIDAGVLNLDRDHMKSAEGASLLCVLIKSTLKAGLAHIAEMDATRNRNNGPAVRALIDRLIEAGVDPWLASSSGQSAWEVALEKGWEDVCLAFLKHPNAPSGEKLAGGISLFGEKQEAPWIALASASNMQQVAKILLLNGANASAIDPAGLSALHHATSHHMVKILLEHGAKASFEESQAHAIESFWAQQVKKSCITPAERSKMLHTLMNEMVSAERRQQYAVESVVRSGLSLGIKEGASLLKKAGLESPLMAKTTRDTTIFFERAALLLNKNFSDGDLPSQLSSGTIDSRFKSAFSWLDRSNASGLDKGALYLIALFTADKRRGITGIPSDIKIEDLTGIESQFLALRALDKMVDLGLVKNGSEIAGTSLAGLRNCGASLEQLLEERDGSSLFSAWMSRVYKGAENPQWLMPNHPYTRSTRPDIPVEKFESRDDGTCIDLLPAAGNAFWSDPLIGTIILNRLCFALCGTKKEAYRDPSAKHCISYNEGQRARLTQVFKPWFDRVDDEVMKSALDTSHGRALFEVIRERLPEIGLDLETNLIKRQTQIVKKTHSGPRL